MQADLAFPRIQPVAGTGLALYYSYRYQTALAVLLGASKARPRASGAARIRQSISAARLLAGRHYVYIARDGLSVKARIIAAYGGGSARLSAALMPVLEEVTVVVGRVPGGGEVRSYSPLRAARLLGPAAVEAVERIAWRLALSLAAAAEQTPSTRLLELLSRLLLEPGAPLQGAAPDMPMRSLYKSAARLAAAGLAELRCRGDLLLAKTGPGVHPRPKNAGWALVPGPALEGALARIRLRRGDCRVYLHRLASMIQPYFFAY